MAPTSSIVKSRLRRKLAWYQTTVVAMGMSSESTRSVSTASDRTTAGKKSLNPSSGSHEE